MAKKKFWLGMVVGCDIGGTFGSIMHWTNLLIGVQI